MRAVATAGWLCTVLVPSFFVLLRPLEKCQVERKLPSPGPGVLDNVLSQLDFSHTSEELLQAEVTRLEGR